MNIQKTMNFIETSLGKNVSIQPRKQRPQPCVCVCVCFSELPYGGGVECLFFVCLYVFLKDRPICDQSTHGGVVFLYANVSSHYTTRKLAYPVKRSHVKRKVVLQPLVFKAHVSFRGSKYIFTCPLNQKKMRLQQTFVAKVWAPTSYNWSENNPF